MIKILTNWIKKHNLSIWEKNFKQGNFPNKIIIHNLGETRHRTKGIGEDYINALHKEKNWRGANGRSTGYHFIISRSFGIQTGREWWMTGAHCKGQNTSSIGILIMEPALFVFDKHGYMLYNKRVMRLLIDQIKCLMEAFDIPHTQIFGHKDLQKMKGKNVNHCPSFDVQTWVKAVKLDQL